MADSTSSIAGSPRRSARSEGSSQATTSLLAYGALALNLGLVLIAVIIGWSKLSGPSWRDGDYAAIHTGWRIVAEGPLRGLDDRLYDLHEQALVQHRVVGVIADKDVLPFVNPPHAALLGAPFGTLSFRAGQLTWLITSLGLLGVAIWRTRALTRNWTVTERRIGLVSALAFPATIVGLLNGTFSVVVLLAFVGFVLAYRQGHEIETGMWLVVLSVKPQYVVLPMIAVLAARKWRTAATAAVFGGAVAGVTTAILGPRIWTSYLHLLNVYSATTDSLGAMPRKMWNLRGLLTGAAGSGTATNGLVLAGLAAAALFTAWCFAQRNKTAPAVDLSLGALIVLTVVTSPHTHSHDTVVLALGAALLWTSGRARSVLGPLLAATPALGYVALGPSVIAQLAIVAAALGVVELVVSERLRQTVGVKRATTARFTPTV